MFVDYGMLMVFGVLVASVFTVSELRTYLKQKKAEAVDSSNINLLRKQAMTSLKTH